MCTPHQSTAYAATSAQPACLTYAVCLQSHWVWLRGALLPTINCHHATSSQHTRNFHIAAFTFVRAACCPSHHVLFCCAAAVVAPRSKQLALLGPLRPQPTKIWKRKFVKLMVVGDSGLGKTTLISALLSKPGEQLQVRARCSCGGLRCSGAAVLRCCRSRASSCRCGWSSSGSSLKESRGYVCAVLLTKLGADVAVVLPEAAVVDVKQWQKWQQMRAVGTAVRC